MTKFFNFLVFIFLINNVGYAQFAGGKGTIEDPYQISTIDQLQEVRFYPDKNFIQINDIEAKETNSWNSGIGFLPIGDDLI
ncbi:MAG: T9SS C-terminal target domain-containing protein, partial [Balneola sp.]